MPEKKEKRPESGLLGAASGLFQISQVSPPRVLVLLLLWTGLDNSELSPAARRYLYNLQGKEGGKEGREVKREGKALGGKEEGVRRKEGGRPEEMKVIRCCFGDKI